MKPSVLLTVLGLSLASCAKDDAELRVAPAPLATGFGQDFTLQYQQAALLPAAAQPELTVTATDFAYSFCPKGMQCIVGPSLWPTLTVTDALGQSQQVKLPANQTGLNTSGWIDSTSVRANGRRYLLYYKKWGFVEGFDGSKDATKNDLTITLQVSKAN